MGKGRHPPWHEQPPKLAFLHTLVTISHLYLCDEEQQISQLFIIKKKIMPVCLIEGPGGLSATAKKELIEKVLDAMVTAYQMVDDRVYVNEYTTENYGDTPHEMADTKWRVQSAPARVIFSIIAPPGLARDAKRILFRSITETAAGIYGITDQRDILAFLHEHPLDNVASNGYIQTENPAFESPATV